MIARSVTLVLAALFLIPVASAATYPFALTDEVNPDAPGAFLLGEDTNADSSGVVRLVAGQPVVWAAASPLSAPAVVDSVFEYDFYFSKHGQMLVVEYGRLVGDQFEAFGSDQVQTVPVSRSAVPDELLPNLIAIRIGQAAGSFPVEGEFDDGDVPAIRLTSEDGDNSLFTEPSLLGASQQSSATVPLPELPAIVLTGLGLATVGAVALVRARRQ